MEKTFNKLVRDNIPNIINNNGEEAIIKTLSDEEYRIELYKKLLEETNEVIDSKSTDETLEELADVLEIIRSIAKLNGKNINDIIELADQKKLKRGGFEKRIFLERTYSNEDKKLGNIMTTLDEYKEHLINYYRWPIDNNEFIKSILRSISTKNNR